MEQTGGRGARFDERSSRNPGAFPATVRGGPSGAPSRPVAVRGGGLRAIFPRSEAFPPPGPAGRRIRGAGWAWDHSCLRHAAMRTLVYLTCFADPAYAEAARLCIASLRGKGRYEGDIAVLTDGVFPERTPGATVVRMPRPSDAFDLRCMKHRAGRILDVSAYDRVLWVDCDVIAIREVAPLFEFCRRGLSAGDEYPFNTLRAPSVGGCLTWWERILFGRRWGVNAGIFCVEARLLRPYLDLWLEEVLRYRARADRWIDQPPLNALIARRRIDFTPYPRGWIEMPPLYEYLGRGRRFVLPPETRLLHYCGIPDKQETLRRMRAHS